MVTVAAGNQLAGPEELLLRMQSNSAVSSGVRVSLGKQSSTVATIPSGISIQTTMGTTYFSAFAMATIFAVDSTVTQVVRNSCYNENAWVLFGWANITLSCTVKLNLIGGQIFSSVVSRLVQHPKASIS